MKKSFSELFPFKDLSIELSNRFFSAGILWTAEIELSDTDDYFEYQFVSFGDWMDGSNIVKNLCIQLHEASGKTLHFDIRSLRQEWIHTFDYSKIKDVIRENHGHDASIEREIASSTGDGPILRPVN